MAIGLLGRKVGMTQVFDAEEGIVIPVTVLEVGPCHVLQVRTKDKDGYDAVQLGFADKSRERASKAERGHVAKIESKRSRERSAAGVAISDKADCEPKRFVREIRGAEASVGDVLDVALFSEVARVDVTGTSKGRGTAGVMKRHNYKGQRATHGVKKVHRHPGSIGCSAYPSRVIKGRRMAGRYGNSKTTVRNVKIYRVDAEDNLLLLRGAVPGPNGGYVVVKQTNMLR